MSSERKLPAQAGGRRTGLAEPGSPCEGSKGSETAEHRAVRSASQPPWRPTHTHSFSPAHSILLLITFYYLLKHFFFFPNHRQTLYLSSYLLICMLLIM